MTRLLVDTSIFIAFERQKSSVLEKLLLAQSEEKAVLYTSPLVVFEYFYGIPTRRKEQNMARELFAEFELLEPKIETAILASNLAQKYQIGPFDTLIAATCLEHECTLVTLNQKHFKMIPKIKMYTV